MFYDTRKGDHGLLMDPVKAIVAPRPIGWVSSRSAAGIANLAPYSFFNIFSTSPHYVAFGSGGRKDSMRNIEATGEFAFNMASFALKDAMNLSSASVDETVDEFELTGLSKEPCQLIAVDRVKAAPAALECKLYQIVPLPDDDGSVNDWLIIGRVVGVHIKDEFLRDGRVDTAAMKLLARLGYSDYLTADTLWRLKRPQ